MTGPEYAKEKTMPPEGRAITRDVENGTYTDLPAWPGTQYATGSDRRRVDHVTAYRLWRDGQPVYTRTVGQGEEWTLAPRYDTNVRDRVARALSSEET